MSSKKKSKSPKSRKTPTSKVERIQKDNYAEIYASFAGYGWGTGIVLRKTFELVAFTPNGSPAQVVVNEKLFSEWSK